MLTINNINNQRNINFTSLPIKLIGNEMAEKYDESCDRFRENLIERNKYGDWIGIRFGILVLAALVALIVGTNVCSESKCKKRANRKVDVAETTIMQQRVKELDEKYKAGALLYEEYLSGLKEVKSDYEKLEAETSQKLDNVIQTRIGHSGSNSTYSINPETGKYNYELSADYKTKTIQINAVNNKIPEQTVMN